MKTGQVIGSTNARGETAQDRPVSVQQVLATLYHALDIDPASAIPNRDGRPMVLLDEREPIAELV